MNNTLFEEIKLDDINIYDIGNTIQIAGTIWSGNGISFVTLLPEKNEDFQNLKLLPMTLVDWERFLKQTDIQETEILQSGPSGIIKALVRKSQRQIDSYLQWNVFKRDDYTCRYCGRTGIPLTVDHVDLWEDGGATIEANLISACRKCNKDRGRQQYEDWLKSPVYLRKSKDLPQEIIDANNTVLVDLPRLKSLRVQNIRSR